MSLLDIGLGDTVRLASSSRHAVMRRRNQERLLVVNGHPDPRPERFCAALCQACLAGATEAGREADIIALGAVFPANGSGTEGELAHALELLRQPARLTVIFPLWLDKPPEIVTRFLEQVERDAQIKSRHAHIVATMSLPAFAHRSMVRQSEYVLRNMSLPGLDIDALNFVGSIDTISQARREEWLYRLRRLGNGGA
jgi:putative NADPH-quinone reductase